MFSTVSFSVEKHYCGTNLVDIAVFFVDHEDVESFCTTEETKVTKESCCKEIIEFYEGQELIQNTSFNDIKLSPQLSFSTVVSSYNDYIQYSTQRAIIVDEYSPPNLDIDRLIQHQVFRI